MAAEQLFPNVVAVVDAGVPATPFFRATIDLSSLGDYAGTGIAVDASYVYVTEESFVVSQDFGVSGNTKLFIAQYLEITDDAGVPPTTTITSPGEGSQHIAGSTTTVVHRLR